MLTVDFDRLGLRAGERVLDMGCGAGRHAFEMYKRGADVIALDQDADELATVSEWFAAMREEGGLPAGAEADVKQGDALNLPFPDGDFDRVVAAEVLEHIPDDEAAIAELVRVLRPGGTIAVTVPRWLPEKVCWALSDAYHEVEGGHVRIYRGSELVARLEDAGLRLVGRDHVHGLHSPYWWLKCAVGVTNDDNPAVKAFHKLLVWDIVKRPLPTRLAEKVLDPLLGKSMVLYLEKPGARESVPPDSQIPAVAGILDASQVQATAVAIARVQQADGGIPWAVGEHIDVWNHVESAMALLVGGQREAAEAAYGWCLRGQRADGSWPMKIVGDTIVDASGETNMSSYLAVGVWHHWLLHRDLAFVRRTWPAVRGGLDFATGLQLPFGGIAWSQQDDGVVNTEALVAGSSSIYHALRAGLSIADLVGEPRPAWELAAGRLRHALESHLDLFLDKATFSMDWYYPVLGGPVRGQEARDRLDGRWDDFVVPGLGARCVDTNPWVTGAETCELALALDVVDDPRAVQVFADMQHLRHEDDMYWTGWVFGDDVNWPDEQTTYTSAAVILAADALSRTTSASGIFRGDGLAPHPAPLALHCDCAPDQVLTSG